MDTIQLENYLFHDPVTAAQQGGVLASDQLPRIVKGTPKLFIANTDVFRRPGTHWVAFYFPLNGLPEFFDSVGKPPNAYSIILKNFIDRNAPDGYWYCGQQIQGSDSTCGHFCLYYSLLRCRGIPLPVILQSFTQDLSYNDWLVKQFVAKQFDIKQ